jgi:hypothetical protein
MSIDSPWTDLTKSVKVGTSTEVWTSYSGFFRRTRSSRKICNFSTQRDFRTFDGVPLQFRTNSEAAFDQDLPHTKIESAALGILRI